MAADPDLLATWTRGWALTRGAAPPVRDDGGWRIEVGAPDQIRRFVHADIGDALARRATAIAEPRVFLKICAEAAAVRPLLPDRWVLRPPGFMMTLNGPMAGSDEAMAEGRLAFRREGPVLFCTITDPAGAETARGRAVRVGHHVIYDRIAVEPAFRRRGLGGRVMRALEAEMGAGPGVLVATEDGRALYRSLGWIRHASYTTAVIPG